MSYQYAAANVELRGEVATNRGPLRLEEVYRPSKVGRITGVSFDGDVELLRGLSFKRAITAPGPVTVAGHGETALVCVLTRFTGGDVEVDGDVFMMDAQQKGTCNVIRFHRRATLETVEFGKRTLLLFSE